MTDNKRAPDFRYIYTNGFNVQFNGGELVITFGFKEDLSAAEQGLYEQVGVAMSASSAKLLGIIVARMIEASEKTGLTIPIDEEKMRHIDRAIAEGERRQAEARAKAASVPNA